MPDGFVAPHICTGIVKGASRQRQPFMRGQRAHKAAESEGRHSLSLDSRLPWGRVQPGAGSACVWI